MIPADPAALESLMRRLSPADRAELDALLRDGEPLWRPQPGAQTQAIESSADVIGYGGAAGGGKSDLLCGLALTQHRRSLIVRRERAQTEGFIQRLTQILGSSDGHNGQKGQWRVDGRLIEFGGIDGADDHQKWQGRAHDLKAFDEATEMREHQVRFIMGWARTSSAGQRVRRLLTFNPPTTAEGRWVIAFFAPWLDDRHPDPAKPGELRWFSTVKGRDLEVPGPEPFVIFKGAPLSDFDPADFGAEKVVTPLSRTFIPSRVTDNIFYMRTGYIQTLQALPEPLRSQMLDGDFKAGIEDDPWQAIPTAWIDAAMARWQPRAARGEMDVIGVDPAMGGKDAFVLSARHGRWFAPLVRVPGAEVPDGQTGAGLVIRHRRDRAVVAIDVVGWGASTLNMLQENEVQCHAVNGAARSVERARDGGLRFANYRAELVWRMREALDPAAPDPLSLPPDPALRADLAAYKWKMTVAGIQVRAKEEMKAELGRSPDDGDAVLMANVAAVKEEAWEAMRDATRFDRYDELPRDRSGLAYDRYDDFAPRG